MSITQAKTISIDELLLRLGHQPTRRTAKGNWYIRPYGQENTASFHTTPDGRAWYDFGEGRGGGIIELAFRMQSILPLPIKLSGEEIRQALAYIESAVASTATYIPRQRLPMSKDPVYSVLNHKSFSVYGRGSFLSKPALYLGTRGINAERFAPYLEDITYTAEDGKHRYGFGMINISGGFELRRFGDWHKIAVGHKDVTIFRAEKEAAPWHCFYSMIDFGTFLTIDKPPVGAYHYLILNSDGLVDRAIGYVESMAAGYMIHYPHRDESGQRAYSKLRDCLIANGWSTGERGHLYEGFKDWTEAREKQLGF